jgi:hypothetical protein
VKQLVMNVHVTIETVEDLNLDRFVGCILNTLSLEIEEVTEDYTGPHRQSDLAPVQLPGRPVLAKFPIYRPDWEPPRLIQRLCIAA